MDPDEKAEPETTDLGTLLHSIGSRLFLLASAIRGAAADRGDGPESAEGRVASELAGDLEAICRRLDLVNGHLCERCLLAEVVEDVRIERTEEGVPSKQEKRGRRRKPR